MQADQYRQRYREASRKDKTVIVQELVDSWRAEDPPERFLAKTDPSKGDDSMWHDVGIERALKKAAKILTEKSVSEHAEASTGRKRQAGGTSRAAPPEDRIQRPRQFHQPTVMRVHPGAAAMFSSMSAFSHAPPVHPTMQQQNHLLLGPQAHAILMGQDVGTTPLGFQQNQQQYNPSSQQHPHAGAMPDLMYGVGMQLPIPSIGVASRPQQLPLGVPGTSIPMVNAFNRAAQQQVSYYSPPTEADEGFPTAVSFPGVFRSSSGSEKPSSSGGSQLPSSASGTFTTMASGPSPAAVQQQGSNDDSPPIEAFAGKIVPTAASLAGVFHSSSSSEKGGSPSTVGSKK